MLEGLGISVGSGSGGGRRRAPDPDAAETAAPTPPAEDESEAKPADITPLSDSGSPVARISERPGGRRRRTRSDLGLGDLLAEALVAYQNASEPGEKAATTEDEDTDSHWPLPRWDYRAE